MTKIIIPKATSNTIYSISNEHYDIEINMGTEFKYAVVLPSYYNAKPSRHKTACRTLEQWRNLHNSGYHGITIIDRDNLTYDCDGYDLYLTN